jgi:hypothetical protein
MREGYIMNRSSVRPSVRCLTLAAFPAVAALALASCMTISLPTAVQAGLRFDTKPEAIPANIEWTNIGKAHELINIKELVVVVGGGTNQISDADWEKYQPPLPWMKNIERNLLFTDTFFIRSPSAPEDATGEKRSIVREISGYTWIELAQPVAVDFVPAAQKTDIVKPAAGHLAIKTIRKPQILRFTGSIYQLTDGRGNFYAMHATETGTPSLDVALPAGWTLRKSDLAEPLVIAPSQGGYYNIVGDCLGQGYHQYIFAGSTYPAN